MSGITIDLAAAREALRELTPRTVALVASIPDLDTPIAGSEWTLGEAAAHLVVGAVDYSEHAKGVRQCYQMDPADLAVSQRRNLAAMVARDGHKLGPDLQLGADAFLNSTIGQAAEDMVRWHAGRFLPCAAMTCVLMGEQLLHGYDIAQTLGSSWPIEPEPARLVVQAVLPLLPGLVDRRSVTKAAATFELAVHGGPQVLARFGDGACSVHPPEIGSVDCHLAGDPVSWLLALYGRVSWEELLRTARIEVTGGDTALGAGFKQLLRNP